MSSVKGKDKQENNPNEEGKKTEGLKKDHQKSETRIEESFTEKQNNINEERTGIESLLNQMDNMCLEGDDKKLSEIKNTVTIPEWLKGYESPFAWHLEQQRGLGPEHVILRTLEKLDELFIEEPEFSLQRFVSLLKLVLEYYVVGEVEKSWENMKIIEGCLEEEISRNDPFYQKVKLSLGHIVSTTKAQLLYISGDEEQSKKIGRCIIPTKIMTNSDKAALHAMKARFFLYSGYENGEEVGVEYARKALEFEPDNGEWEYLLAKILRQQRRQVPFSMDIPRDEMKLLESAVEKNKNPKILVYLAQVYRECSAQAFKQYKTQPQFYHSELHKTIENMAVKALDYYKEALMQCSDSPGVLRRVGYGIMNLPNKIADYNLALNCLQKSLEISENQMTLHVLGTYYHRFGNDNQKALEYFEKTAKSGSWFGLSDMIRIKYLLNPDYDPCPDFELGLSWTMKKNYRFQILSQMGGYYLFIKRDFYKSIECYKQIISEDKDSPFMKNFKSIFLRMNEPIDLYKYLANEALLLLQKHNTSSTVEPETSEEEEEHENRPINLGYVEDFLDIISELYPQLMEITPDPILISKLIQTSKDIEANSNRYKNNQGNRNNFRSSNRGWGRGGNYSGNRRGRGGNQEGSERRGRFSLSNQSEPSHEDLERRGGFRRNWRQEPRDSSHKIDKGQTTREGYQNWRKK